MNQRYPLYEGDGVIRYGKSAHDSPVGSEEMLDPGTEIVRRDNLSLNEFRQIEIEARLLRQEALRRLAGRFRAWLGKFFVSATQRRTDSALSNATYHVDLERRLRRLERDRITT